MYNEDEVTKTMNCPDCETPMIYGNYGTSLTLFGYVCCGGFKCSKCGKTITDKEAAESFRKISPKDQLNNLFW
jgi:C4-type Zn-finger protein